MNKESHSISLMCRFYGVSRNGYNSWRRRGLSQRQQDDAELFLLINRLFKKHDSCFGSPKITQELRRQGVKVGQKRVARIMREHGLKAVKATLYRTKKVKSILDKASPNRIHHLTLSRENQVWVGDVTYIKMPDGQWQYLSVILDKHSRRVVAWSLSGRRDAKPTVSTLKRAVRNRGYPDGVIFHSDKGIEYLANKFREYLNYYGILQSMNRVKEMNDNAEMESFFQQFKTERIKRRRFTSQEELRAIISEYMKYYNFNRIHSSIGYLTPHEFEGKIHGNKRVCAKEG